MELLRLLCGRHVGTYEGRLETHRRNSRGGLGVVAPRTSDTTLGICGKSMNIPIDKSRKHLLTEDQSLSKFRVFKFSKWFGRYNFCNGESPYLLLKIVAAGFPYPRLKLWMQSRITALEIYWLLGFTMP